jgi:hypothetical protein
VLAAAIPQARDALTDPVTITKLTRFWIILGAAGISLSASSIGVLVQMLSGHSLW